MPHVAPLFPLVYTFPSNHAATPAPPPPSSRLPGTPHLEPILKAHGTSKHQGAVFTQTQPSSSTAPRHCRRLLLARHLHCCQVGDIQRWLTVHGVIQLGFGAWVCDKGGGCCEYSRVGRGGTDQGREMGGNKSTLQCIAKATTGIAATACHAPSFKQTLLVPSPLHPLHTTCLVFQPQFTT